MEPPRKLIAGTFVPLHMSSAPIDAASLNLRVQACHMEGEGVFSFELRPVAPQILPPFEAGAHLDVLLPGGIKRSYSLLNAPSERHRYVIAVKRIADSKGGSAFMCDSLRVGQTIDIKPPRNSFPLDETAARSVFIAGGIGITPLLSMMHRMDELGRDWSLFFAASCEAAAPFSSQLDAFERHKAGRVTRYFSDAPAAVRLDLPAIVAGQPANTQFYCCGPVAMLKAFEQATAALPPGHAHVEYFSSDQEAAAGGFDVVLARSGRTLRIPADKTILETLLLDGMDLPRSCMEGVCGTCETVVLEGVPDHRDQVLSPRERRANTKMMICRSGCLGDRLVLDL